jgi:hypothetical protein
VDSPTNLKVGRLLSTVNTCTSFALRCAHWSVTVPDRSEDALKPALGAGARIHRVVATGRRVSYAPYVLVMCCVATCRYALVQKLFDLADQDSDGEITYSEM